MRDRSAPSPKGKGLKVEVLKVKMKIVAEILFKGTLSRSAIFLNVKVLILLSSEIYL